MSNTLRCKNITFKFGIRPILDDISIQFGKGHLYGILGPNGSGKTTLIKILSGVLKPSHGKVFINEKNMKNISIGDRAKELAVVNQSNPLQFDFTVSEIVKMGRYVHVNKFLREPDNEKIIINDILNEFNLCNLRDRNFNHLSGGEQQKVIIARSVAQQSKIILLDEPTTHLDINYEIELMEKLKQYVDDGLIIIIVLHNLNLAAQFCDKIILLNQNNITAFGNPEDVITKENIKKVYNVDVLIKKNPISNSIYIIPLKKEIFNSLKHKEEAKIKKIHLVGGGGCGLEILPRLQKHDVSVGIVSVLDDDYNLANYFNYQTIAEAPFSPISKESSEILKNHLKSVDLIILANIPFGKANLENLKLLNDTNKPIIIYERDSIENRDYTNGIATKIYNEIKNKKNVKTVNNLNDIFNFD
ncbi:MAG: ABC transporter ATP-binding protein [Candidatus Lokiarchaeota archaeon]|nr:ABC transporter ATP-binding protein [Candidatus Lokiarchaeota archaeon]